MHLCYIGHMNKTLRDLVLGVVHQQHSFYFYQGKTCDYRGNDDYLYLEVFLAYMLSRKWNGHCSLIEKHYYCKPQKTLECLTPEVVEEIYNMFDSRHEFQPDFEINMIDPNCFIVHEVGVVLPCMRKQ